MRVYVPSPPARSMELNAPRGISEGVLTNASISVKTLNAEKKVQGSNGGNRETDLYSPAVCALHRTTLAENRQEVKCILQST